MTGPKSGVEWAAAIGLNDRTSPLTNTQVRPNERLVSAEKRRLEALKT